MPRGTFFRLIFAKLPCIMPRYVRGPGLSEGRFRSEGSFPFPERRPEFLDHISNILKGGQRFGKRHGEMVQQQEGVRFY